MPYLKKIEIQENSEEIQYSPFYLMVSQLNAPRTLLKMIEMGWCTDFNETYSVQQITVLMNLIASGIKEDALSVSHPKNAFNVVEQYHASDFSKVILEMMKRGANPWIGTPPQNLYYEDQRSYKTTPNNAISIDAFDQAIHGGFSDVIDFALSLKHAPSIEMLSKRTITGCYQDNYTNKIEVPYIHAAVLNNRFDIVDILLKHGMSLELKDKYGQTPIFYAQNNASLRALIQRKAQIIVRDEQNNLPSKKWKDELTLSVSNEMIRTLQPLLVQNLKNLSEEEKWIIIRERALEILQKGQKGALIDLIKGAGYSIQDLYFESPTHPKHRESLLFHASMNLLISPSIAFHGVSIGLKDSQHDYESIPGIPDIFWAYLATKMAEDRNGLTEIQNQTKEKLSKIIPHFYIQETNKVNLRILQLYITSSLIKRPHEAFSFLIHFFVNNNNKKIEKLINPTTPEQAQFGLNEDPLIFQFFEAMNKEHFLTSIDFLSFWKNSDEKIKIDSLNYASFWKMLKDFEAPRHYYYYNIMNDFWEFIDRKKIQHPSCSLNAEEINDILDFHKSCFEYNQNNQQYSDFGKSWLEKWRLDKSIQKAETNQESSIFPAKPKNRL